MPSAGNPAAVCGQLEDFHLTDNPVYLRIDLGVLNGVLSNDAVVLVTEGRTSHAASDFDQRNVLADGQGLRR